MTKTTSFFTPEEMARRYRFIVDSFKESVTMIDRDYIYQAANETYCKAQGKKPEEIVGRSVRDLWGNDVFVNVVKVYLDKCFAGDEIHDEAWFEFPTGGLKCFAAAYYPYRDSQGAVTHAVVMSRDVTDHKNLEEEFRQVQKMQVMGRLVAGVSHDFNNILTVIVGYGEMLSMKFQESDPNRSDVQEILKAAARAKRLTTQLLAFSHRQAAQTKIFNLNELIQDMQKMILRILGEHIEHVAQLKTDLWPIKGDPGHLEQVILNLTVNARDAMSGKGKLTISTDNVTLDQTFAKAHTDVVPGDYVLLAARDSGCGMTEEVKARIFEPFFTTKGKEGTGLGLATCYGIVKESAGHILVESEPGRGTTFNIYLPRTETPQEAPAAAEDVRRAPRGTETILWVEDNVELRKFVSSALRQLGYRVFEAANGQEALHLVQELRDEKLNLFFTDVLLPMVSGKVLADRIKQDRPDMKTLFTSGYPDNVLNEHGVLKPGIELLRKPFWPATLALKVRAVLDGN